MENPLDPNPFFVPINNGWGVQPTHESTPFGGDVHDTFGVNQQGDLFGGHTTINVPGYDPMHLPWEPKP